MFDRLVLDVDVLDNTLALDMLIHLRPPESGVLGNAGVGMIDGNYVNEIVGQ